jgi:hypothetical protein
VPQAIKTFPVLRFPFSQKTPFAVKVQNLLKYSLKVQNIHLHLMTSKMRKQIKEVVEKPWLAVETPWPVVVPHQRMGIIGENMDKNK